MTTKSLSRLEVKDADHGLVEAIFSTFDVVDLDGDVVRKSAFTNGQAVVIGAHNHTSWDGALPVGKGVIRVTDSEAVLEGEYFLNTSHGADAFHTMKALSADGLQEWSYSLRGIKSSRITVDGREAREITAMDPITEVSQVLKGASIGTRTLAVKSNKFSECADIALRDVKQLREMAVERLSLRAAEGKSISEQTEAYDQLCAEVARFKSAIDDVTQPSHSDRDELERIYLRLVAATT